ncbi:MAG: hypothetical protein DME71_12875 [Verrucomicrobia bacterium]|nr:MAG: hypothetical protein DME71_12875 [Verrucomicrobiota bacterium]
MAIKVQPFVIDEAVLDLIGNEFRFDHAKGLAEWLKNSSDAYLREGVPDANQVMIVPFTETGKSLTRIECIDFVGMSKRQIDEAFKRFFDPQAAKKGAKQPDLKTLGGHGNGGKFYMRQMFKTSRAITYRDGLMNIFGFNAQRQYGFEQRFENRKIDWDEALTTAGIDKLHLPEEIIDQLRHGTTGFTVVIGEKPERVKGTSTLKVLLDKLIFHPQARRLIERKPVFAVFNDEKELHRLTAPKLEPKEGFELPTIIEIPSSLTHEGETITFTSANYAVPGWLRLKTSSEPLRGNLSTLNAIDFIGEVGVIGNYRVHELGATRFSGQVEFIYGECECPILEDPDHDSVRNDRQKLIENDRTNALLEWVREQVESLAERMETKNRQERKAQDRKNTSALNEILNRWKDRFMNQVWTEMFAGQGPAGVSGADKTGGGVGKGHQEHGGGKKTEGQEGGSEKVRKPRFPQVLVSGQDHNPLDPLATVLFTCDPRHPAVYQRTKDVPAGIYWINTSRPLAEKVINEYTADSPRWREYLFQRYVEIIQKEAVYQLGKMSATLSADDVIRQLDDVTTRVHDQAAKDLSSFLFQESLNATIK